MKFTQRSPNFKTLIRAPLTSCKCHKRSALQTASFPFIRLFDVRSKRLDCQLANKPDLRVARCRGLRNKKAHEAVVCHRQTPTLVINPIRLGCLMNWRAAVRMADGRPQYSNYQSHTLLGRAHFSRRHCQTGWMSGRWIDMQWKTCADCLIHLQT